MRRFKLFTAALIAAMAVVASEAVAASAGQLPLQLSDNFNGTSLTPGVWGYIDGGGGSQNAGTTLSVQRPRCS